jgi:hypothetical protein
MLTSKPCSNSKDVDKEILRLNDEVAALPKRVAAIAGNLIYMERRMPRTQLDGLFVRCKCAAPEPTDQEISEALLSTREILRGYMGPKRSSCGTCRIEGRDQARETFRTNHGINFEFLHLLNSLNRAWRRSSDLGGRPLVVIRMFAWTPTSGNARKVGGTVTGRSDVMCLKLLIFKLLTSMQRLEGSVLTN